MGLFNFNITVPAANTNTATSNTQETPTSAPQVIELQLNEESVTVPFAEAENSTISELFDRYADDLGDTGRISRFVAAGRIVDGNDTPQAGLIYRGAISSESKG